MKKSPWKKYIAGVLAFGMLAAQPGIVYAEGAAAAVGIEELETAADETVEDLETMEETAGTDETETETETEMPGTTETETGAEAPETMETETGTETPETMETETGTETPETTETETGTEMPETEPETLPAESETFSEAVEMTEKETEAPPKESETPKAEEKPVDAKPAEAFQSFLSSAQFSKIQERIQYNVTVPIEGLPSFITQEMIVGALKCQDETGYPASVTIAQIIQESGFCSYGPGGDEKEGLSYLAYQYCNLFGIKGEGTNGSAVMSTLEMTADGQLYTTNAAFRAYHTYTEAIEDRSKLLTEVYSDLIKDVKDANTFAVRIGSRWATDTGYGISLIRLMETYDLYRLDDLTLTDFSAMIGRFANPCPGAVITSAFGYRDFDHAFHKGLDLGTGSENIPTYAAESGIVTFAGYSNSAGNYIVIDHGGGLVTKYMHHAEIYVTEGQTVEKGQQIGLSGTTGDSTGNHLHFQVEENGAAADPLIYLQDEGSGEVLKMGQNKKNPGTLTSNYFQPSCLKLPEISKISKIK